MTRPTAEALPLVDPRLARTLWQWLALGALAVVAWPAALGHGAWFGWTPYWAVIAPAIALLVAYRSRWTRGEAARATAHRRRPRGARGQAQRAAMPRRNRHQRVA